MRNKTASLWTLFIAFICFIKLSICDEDLEGHASYIIYHSLEPSSSAPVFEQRGIVRYYSNRNEAIYTEDGPFSSEKLEKLKNLATDDIYRIKILPKGAENDNLSVFSFTKACAIYESELSDTLTITLDQSGLPVSIAISASSSYCTGGFVPDSSLLNFNTSVNIVTLVNGPSPDTLTYIQRLEQEKAEKARGEQGDNRSFLSKYWMYIVPFVIFLFISGASSPEGQGGGR